MSYSPLRAEGLALSAVLFYDRDGVNMLGWKPSSALLANQSEEEVPPESLATALQEDVPIIIDIGWPRNRTGTASRHR
jgi:hypothetical protein